jgi:hypothetical protein
MSLIDLNRSNFLKRKKKKREKQVCLNRIISNNMRMKNESKKKTFEEI